ncbi:MAG: hypothetical protein AB7P40_19700 [Chloroflexota bacterium]
MFRWPVHLTPLSHASSGTARDTTLEITPRGAVFTLAALSHIGHPAHLALIDGYLKGQMRVSASGGLGDDSRLLATALAAPLVTASELGLASISLSHLAMLPPEASQDVNSRGVRTVDSPRFLLRTSATPEGWLWVRGAERFEPAGCTGTPQPGLGSSWHEVIVQLPARPLVTAWSVPEPDLPPIDAELRPATQFAAVPPVLATALRRLALARFARAGRLLQEAATEAIHLLESSGEAFGRLLADDLYRERLSWRPGDQTPMAASPSELAAALQSSIGRRQPAETVLHWKGLPFPVSLAPDPDGYQTLCLLPPAADGPDRPFELMRDVTWEVIEALMGRPLAEYRTEAIALRLVSVDGRTTTLEIGASVVVVRNQIVFTAWVGSDGRVMLKLFPRGGMQAG